MDAADVAQNAARCTNNDVQACWLLGRMAGTALHAPTGASSEAAFDVRACIAGDPAACDSLGRAAQKAGLPVGGLSQGAENAQRCATGDRPACARLGRSIAAAVS
jgi:hypothetical protein